MSIFINLLCTNSVTGVCQRYYVPDGTQCYDLGQGPACANEGDITSVTPPIVGSGRCYNIRAFSTTQVQWVNVYGQTKVDNILAGNTVRLCSLSEPVEVPSRLDLLVELCGANVSCTQPHQSISDARVNPCSGGVCGGQSGTAATTTTTTTSPGTTSGTTSTNTNITTTTTVAPVLTTITSAQLTNAFSIEFETTPRSVTYRKYTSDTIPSYTVILRNSSDVFHIRAFNSGSSSYMYAVDLDTNITLTNTNGILLAPQESKTILVSFRPAQVDSDPSLESPVLQFRLEALRDDSIAPATTTTTTQSPVTTTTTTRPPSGGGGSNGGGSGGGSGGGGGVGGGDDPDDTYGYTPNPRNDRAGPADQ